MPQTTGKVRGRRYWSVTPNRRKRSYPGGSTAIGKTAWYYQQKDGLHVITQLLDGQGQYAGTTQAKIPWRLVVEALAMHRKVQRERKQARR